MGSVDQQHSDNPRDVEILNFGLLGRVRKIPAIRVTLDGAHEG